MMNRAHCKSAVGTSEYVAHKSAVILWKLCSFAGQGLLCIELLLQCTIYKRSRGDSRAANLRHRGGNRIR